MSVEWDQLFGFSVPPLELVVRGTAMFFFLWLLFRVVIKRRIGAIGMADLLVLVIIADAAQNGMAGSYTSVTDACVLVSTIVLWNYLAPGAALAAGTGGEAAREGREGRVGSRAGLRRARRAHQHHQTQREINGRYAALASGSSRMKSSW